MFLPSSADLHKVHSEKLGKLFSSFSDSADPQIYERNMIHLLCIIYKPSKYLNEIYWISFHISCFKASRGLKCDYCEYQTKWMSHCHNLTHINTSYNLNSFYHLSCLNLCHLPPWFSPPWNAVTPAYTSKGPQADT